MAWTTPPTFTDGNVLSATQLNVLSDNCEYLYGLVTAPNVPFSSLKSTGTSLDSTNNSWFIRHKYNYFHFRIEFGTEDIHADGLGIYLDGNEIFQSDDDWVNATDTISIGFGTGISTTDTAVFGYVDISGLSLTVGTWYEIYVDVPFSAGGSDYCVVAYMLESDSTSLLPV